MSAILHRSKLPPRTRGWIIEAPLLSRPESAGQHRSQVGYGSYGKPDIMYTREIPIEHRRFTGKEGLLVEEIKFSSGRLLHQSSGPQKTQFESMVNHARYFQYAPVVMVVGFGGKKGTYRTIEKWLVERETIPFVIALGGK
jgi:hypothetical protein